MHQMEIFPVFGGKINKNTCPDHFKACISLTKVYFNIIPVAGFQLPIGTIVLFTTSRIV